jgi:NADH dehydrogenase
METPKVVILGAGFGGLTAARALSKHAEVILIDRHNFQTFLPLLYQVSTAGLAADHVAYPIRGALRKTNVQFRMGTPDKLNAAASELTLSITACGIGNTIHDRRAMTRFVFKERKR